MAKRTKDPNKIISAFKLSGNIVTDISNGETVITDVKCDTVYAANRIVECVSLFSRIENPKEYMRKNIIECSKLRARIAELEKQIKTNI